MRTRNIVALHGVGAPEPGSLLPGMMQALTTHQGSKPAPVFTPVDIIAGTRAYEGIRVDRGADRLFLWDANWSHVHLAPKSWLGLFPFLLRLLVATVNVAGTGWPRTSATAAGGVLSEEPKAGAWLGSGWGYHLFFVYVLLWIVALPALSLAHSVFGTSLTFRLLAAAIMFGTLGVALSLRGTDGHAFAGGIMWCIGIGALGLFLLKGGEIPAVPLWVQGALVLAGPALIAVSAIEALLRGVPAHALLSRIGLLILSFAFMSGVMAAILAANLFAVDRLAGEDQARQKALDSWSSEYVCSLPYHVGRAEYATGLATAFVLILLLIAGVWWWFRRTKPMSGAWLRTRLALICWLVIPLLFAGVVLYIGHDIFQVLQAPADRDCTVDLPMIYGRSALRLLPLVAMVALPPMRLALDVMADVLLYLHESERVQASFLEFLNVLAASGDEIVVVAHSQGSRIAVDTLFRPDCPVQASRLATTGSPVGVVYAEFLDKADLPQERPNWTWRNYWRGSDFIGGEIKGRTNDWPSNHEITNNLKMHHINYWIEHEVMAFLLDEERGRPVAGS